MMEKRMTEFCMLVEVNTEENRAVYEDLKRSILIDLEKKEIINKEL